MSAPVLTLGLFDNSGTLIRTFQIAFNKFDLDTTPGSGQDDSQGYVAGSLVADRVAHKVYVCTDNTTSAASWQQITTGGGGGGTVTSIDVSGGTTGMTFTGGPITTSGTITMSGTLDVDNGGTGQTSYTDGQLLIGNSTGNTLTKATLTQGTGISITNGHGSITISATGGTGTVASVDVSGGTTGLTTSGGPITTSGTITIAGTLIVANGGTGHTSFTSHGVLLGNGSSGLNVTAAMTDGQLLVGQTSADPLPKTMSGDATMAASGALTVATVNGKTAIVSDGSVSFAANESMGGFKLTSLGNATTATDAMNMAMVYGASPYTYTQGGF